LPIEIDDETAGPSWAAMAPLAESHRLTVYDAAYLELAMRRDLPLATRDEVLIAAANGAGVPLLPST
jgi:predicted nucleic acid-binding protein